MKPDDVVTVVNRSTGMVRYRLPEDHIVRTFAPGNEKHVPFKEMIALSQQEGGRKLIYEYLLIKELDAASQALEMDINKEVEYKMTEAQVKEWMHTSTLDQFKDALDFAPAGVKDYIKKYAVELPLNDVAKRAAIKEQLGFNVEAAIVAKKAAEEDVKPAERPSERRVAPEAMETASAPRQRRARTTDS